MIKATRRQIIPRIILMLALVSLLGFGCSMDEGPLTSSGSAETSSLQQHDTDIGIGSPYPDLTDADLENLIPGFEVVSMSTRDANGTLDDYSSRRIRRFVGGTVSHRNCGVEIGPWQLWSDQTVTVSTPRPGRSVVDFYPHPYQFNGNIRIWIDLNTIELPPGRRWDELAFFYDEGDGTYTRYWGVIDLQNMTYSAWPDHFSRYIITLPSEGDGGE